MRVVACQSAPPSGAPAHSFSELLAAERLRMAFTARLTVLPESASFQIVCALSCAVWLRAGMPISPDPSSGSALRCARRTTLIVPAMAPSPVSAELPWMISMRSTCAGGRVSGFSPSGGGSPSSSTSV
jgi:hypothetical protein